MNYVGEISYLPLPLRSLMASYFIYWCSVMEDSETRSISNLGFLLLSILIYLYSLILGQNEVGFFFFALFFLDD